MDWYSSTVLSYVGTKKYNGDDVTKDISDFEKERLGEYKISITNNIWIPIKINTLCETQSGEPMEEYQQIYNELHFGYPRKDIKDMIGNIKDY